MHSEFVIRKALYRAGSFVYNENLFNMMTSLKWWCMQVSCVFAAVTYVCASWSEKKGQIEMKEFTYVIKEELGLHARPAGLLVKEAKKFQSATTLAAKGKTAAAGKLIAIMSMGVKQGDEVTVQVEGPDEDAAFEALEKFFQENL